MEICLQIEVIDGKTNLKRILQHFISFVLYFVPLHKDLLKIQTSGSF
jgi:hypothetical protein